MWQPTPANPKWIRHVLRVSRLGFCSAPGGARTWGPWWCASWWGGLKLPAVYLSQRGKWVELYTTQLNMQGRDVRGEIKNKIKQVPREEHRPLAANGSRTMSGGKTRRRAAPAAHTALSRARAHIHAHIHAHTQTHAPPAVAAVTRWASTPRPQKSLSTNIAHLSAVASPGHCRRWRLRYFPALRGRSHRCPFHQEYHHRDAAERPTASSSWLPLSGFCHPCRFTKRRQQGMTGLVTAASQSSGLPESHPTPELHVAATFRQ